VGPMSYCRRFSSGKKVLVLRNVLARTLLKCSIRAAVIKVHAPRFWVKVGGD
jgi:hypothetical protein